MAEILHHVIYSLVLVSQASSSLDKKRRKQIKPDIASPYSRLCKPDHAPTTKLFGNDLLKQLKDMTDVTRVGKQLQIKRKQQTKNPIIRNLMIAPGLTSIRNTLTGSLF